MFFGVLRMIHIISASTALLLGLCAFLAPKQAGIHPTLGRVYGAFVGLTCLTAIVMGGMHWRTSLYLIPLAILAYSLVIQGRRAIRQPSAYSSHRHIRGMLGSYITLCTAYLITNGSRLPVFSAWPTWTHWLLPSLIGIPMIQIIRRLSNTQFKKT